MSAVPEPIIDVLSLASIAPARGALASLSTAREISRAIRIKYSQGFSRFLLINGIDLARKWARAYIVFATTIGPAERFRRIVDYTTY
jgi:hypothetical protein